MIRAEIKDDWLWLAWGLAEGDALRAKEIISNMSYSEIATFYAIKAYHDSWQPPKAKK